MRLCYLSSLVLHVQVYRKMMQQGVWPSITTFGTLLTATSHAGSYETVKQVCQGSLGLGWSFCKHLGTNKFAAHENRQMMPHEGEAQRGRCRSLAVSPSICSPAQCK